MSAMNASTSPNQALTMLTMTWHDTPAQLMAALAAAEAREDHAIVSARLPLLADLTVAENIALPRAWHLGVKADMARLQARDFTVRLLPLDRADAYPGMLSPLETFAVLWLRAVALPGRIVVIDSPHASFGVGEAAIRDCAERCHGLFQAVHAHECRAAAQWVTEGSDV